MLGEISSVNTFNPANPLQIIKQNSTFFNLAQMAVDLHVLEEV